MVNRAMREGCRSFLAAILITILWAPAAFAADQIVEIEVRSLAQHRQLAAIGARSLTCRSTTGKTPWLVTPEQLAAIEQLQLDPNVLVEDVDRLVADQRERVRQSRLQRNGSWFSEYKNYAEIEAYIDTLVALEPTLVTKLNVGQSLEGRTIWGMKITGPGADKPAVLFNGTQHAREWLSPMTNMYIADQLVRQYDSDARVQNIVDAVEFYIVPVVNPDGYEYTWTTERFWRKNRRDNGDGTFGVDLNRNWPVDFGGPFSSGSTSSDTYRGPFAISEPESQAMRDFIESRPNLAAHIDFHSYAQEILQPWAFTNTLPPNFAVVDELGSQMRDAIFAETGVDYPNASGAGGVGLASGVFPDWTTDARDLLGYTIEVRPTCCGLDGFDPPPSLILPTGQENFAAALVMAEFIEQAVQISFPIGLPSSSDVETPATVRLQATSITGVSVDTASAKLFTSVDGGPLVETAMSHLGGNVFEATLPSAPCGSDIAYYFSVDNASGSTFTSPDDAPATTYNVAVVDVLIADDFQINEGWTTETLGASSGQWQRGVPVNDPSWDHDPIADSDGSGACWLTQNENGNTDVDNGAVRLNSTSYDLAGAAVEISYDYYLKLTDEDGADALIVEISTNGAAGPWTEIARHDTDGGLDWRNNIVTQSELDAAGVTLSADTRLRFTVNDADAQSIVEAGVDALSIVNTECETDRPADLNDDGTVDTFDLLTMLEQWGACDAPCPPNCNADISGSSDVPDCVVDTFDLLVLLGDWG